MLYMVTFTINIPQMLAYIPYMDPMGKYNNIYVALNKTMAASSPQMSLLSWLCRPHDPIGQMASSIQAEQR
jgi:hypothetical protein